MSNARQAIARLKTRLENSAARVGGTVPQGALRHFMAKPIAHGGYAVIGCYEPNKASVDAASAPPSKPGYAINYWRDGQSPLGVSPQNSPHPEANRLHGFAGGGWQYSAQFACRLAKLSGVKAASYGVWAVGSTGVAALVATGFDVSSTYCLVRAAATANLLLGSAFEVEPNGGGAASLGTK